MLLYCAEYAMRQYIVARYPHADGDVEICDGSIATRSKRKVSYASALLVFWSQTSQRRMPQQGLSTSRKSAGR